MLMKGYHGRRHNPYVLGGIVAAHAAALFALALVKPEIIKNPLGPIEVVDIPIDPPPPVEPPPPELNPKPAAPQARSDMTVFKQDIVIPAPGPVVPLAPVPDINPFSGPIGQDTVIAPPATVPLPPAPPRADPPLAKPVAVKPRGNPGEWVTNDDYPDAALRAEEQGRTRFRIEVGANGRPTSCTVTASSGSASLDNAACRLLMRRARFVPGKDANGDPVGGAYANSFNWRIPED